MATVLVAESDHGLGHLFRLLLRQQYVVVLVPSAARAVETLRSSPDPVIVLWDLWLSTAPGPHVLDMIEEEPAIGRHAFLLLTPEVEGISPAHRRKARRLRIPVIRMPFDVDHLLGQIEQARQSTTRRLQASS